MKKNEAKLYGNIDQIQNNFIKLKFMRSKTSTQLKFNFSRNSFSKNKNKTASNFIIYKNSQISDNNSKNITKKNEEPLKKDINSISNQKLVLINFVQCNPNFTRRKSSQEIKSRVCSSKTCDSKNNSYNSYRCLNKTQINERKADFIKYKFLLEQNNYFKPMFQKNDFGFSSFHSKQINPCLRKNNKKCIFNINKIKKDFSEQNLKVNSMKNGNENCYISSYKDLKSIHNKKNIFRIKNYTSIKIKKYITPNILKQSNESLFDCNDNIRSKRNNLIDKSKKIKNNNYNHQKHKFYDEHNKSNENEKIIDDNYNEYLKDISSSESNNIKFEPNSLIKKSGKVPNKRLKSLNNKLPLNDKSEINQYIKRLNKYNYSNIIIKNNKKLFELKKLNSNRKKNMDDFSKSISKSIVIENSTSRKKK